MKLVHATHLDNLASILKTGLLCSKATGKKKVVWAASPAKTAWAVLHVIRRHGVMPQDVVVLEVDLPKGWLKKHGGAQKGLWYSEKDVPAVRIEKVLTFGLLSKSPVEENE